MRRVELLLIGATMAMLTGLIGCTVEERPVVVAEPASVTTTAPEAPPQLREEVLGIAPSPLHVWVPGYWAWHDRWVWIAGRWALPPHRETVWIPGRWDRHAHDWVWRPGHWR